MLIGYVLMVDVERDGLVRPDELLQTLRAIPMTFPNGAWLTLLFSMTCLLPIFCCRECVSTIYTHRPRTICSVDSSTNTPQHAEQPYTGTTCSPGFLTPSNAPPPYPTPNKQHLAWTPPTAAKPHPASPPPTLPAPQQPVHAYPAAPQPQPYQQPQPVAPVYPASPPSPPPPQPIGAVPYMITGQAGQPPVVGYILPYQQVRVTGKREWCVLVGADLIR